MTSKIAYYHVTSRGNEQKEIFKSIKDREQFLHYLETATTRYGVVVHIYCLMSNQYHLLLETPKGNLPQIMRYINGAYSTYFNMKRKSARHLFQGRYKAILAEADEYAQELSRYIHLNPVRAGMVNRSAKYPWPSQLLTLERSGAFINLYHKYSGAKLKEIRTCFNLKDAAVSHATRYFSIQITKDKALRSCYKDRR